MGGKHTLALVTLIILVLQGDYFKTGVSVVVTYDHRALVIDGQRRILQSGSIHYPRSTPEVRFYLFFSISFELYLLFKLYRGNVLNDTYYAN